MEDKQEIKSNSVIFAGPFMGEFGWELSHWMPHVRWLRRKYSGRQLIVSSYPGRQPLYCDIADGFIQLPGWFVSQKYDCDCFEALSTNGHYEKLIQYFKDFFAKKVLPQNFLWTKTPRGFNKILRDQKQVVYERLRQSNEADAIANDLIEKYGGKPIIILFARSVNRKMFWDIVSNVPAYIDDHYPDGLPTRNYPHSSWETFFQMLYSRYGKQFTLAIGGTKDENCLLDIAEKYETVINLTELDITKSLDVTIAILNKAFLSISSQSGPTHLSVQCGCPSFVYGHEMERHTDWDNPLKTDVVFYQTQLGAYNDPPESLFKEISVYIHQLSIEKQIPILSSELMVVNDKPKKIRKIGMVGVFDNPNSTNISFGKAFVNKGFHVETFNYRTVARNIGIDQMNKEIEKFAANFDLIVFCKGNGIQPETIANCSKVAKTCWYMMDAKNHLESNPSYYEMAKMVDFNIVTTGTVKEALTEIGIKNTYRIMQGVDLNKFRPMENKKTEDVVFIGQKTEKRDTIIDSLKADGISIVSYGLGYGKECYGEDFNQICSDAKILLAINNTDSNQDSFSDRVLRYLSTKGCVITEYSKGLEKYFVNRKHLAWPVGDETFTEVIKRYLEHPQMREQMAERGYQYIIEKYTWDKVADRIIEIVEGTYNEEKEI